MNLSNDYQKTSFRAIYAGEACLLPNPDLYYRRHHEGDNIAEPVTTPLPTDIVAKFG